MKVVFLDIDGVLNPDSFAAHSDTPFSSTNVYRFNEIIEQTGAKIVVSSDWRLLIGEKEDCDFATLADFIDFLREHGVEGEVLDVTPDLCASGQLRGEEILLWRQQHPKVTQFVILDDHLDPYMPPQNTVEIDSQIGLTSAQAQQAIRILMQK